MYEFRYYLFLICCVGLFTNANAQYEGDALFDESILHEVRIEIPVTVSRLVDIHLENFDPGRSTPYTMGTVTIDGNLIDSVGVRAKGGLSAFDPKAPLKLDFNEFVSGQRYDGLKKVNLQQGNMEASFMREAIAYHILRKAGVKASRTSFAKVFVNNNYEGIYTLVEQINDAFIKNRFASSNGTLYKEIDGLKIKFEQDHSITWGQVDTLVMETPAEDLHLVLNDYVDVESFIRFFATQVFINARDSPIDLGVNYYLYFEPKSKTYVYIPWDFNLALFNGGSIALFPFSANAIFNKLKLNPELRQRYIDTFCRLFSYAFVNENIQSLIDDYTQLLSPELPNDPYINVIGDWQTGIQDVRNTISSRHDTLRAEVEQILETCDDIVIPVQIGDLAINEVVASNSMEGGIADPAGGYPDWIELYNNSNSSIDLSNFYLSNDVDVLKHWRFPARTNIAAGEYLIIWADRDIEEEGLHCDFKLNKTRGDLFLSFEDDTILDMISFSDQANNIALARIPNGTGDFNQQAPTFAANNDPVSSTTQASFITEAYISPNPAINEAWVHISSKARQDLRIQIRNVNGQILKVYQLALVQGTNTLYLPTDNLSAGLYFVDLIDDSQTVQQRLRWIVHTNN